jgi:hypothetical protein
MQYNELVIPILLRSLWKSPMKFNHDKWIILVVGSGNTLVYKPLFA